VDRTSSGEEAVAESTGVKKVTEEKIGPKNGSAKGLIGLGACQLCRQSEFLSAGWAGEVFDV